MKSVAVLMVTVIVVGTACAEDSLEAILQKRDAVLSQLVDTAKSGITAGRTTAEDVSAATIRLYSFRREIAKTPADRIKWQEAILAQEKEAAARVAKRIEIGLQGTSDSLEAQERVLAAEQKLAELRLEK